MPYYKNDPRRITAKFTSSCSKCHKTVRWGDKIIYYPLHKHVFCEPCGEPEYRQFLSSAHEEDGYGPYAY